MKTTITALILFLSPVFSAVGVLSGKSNQLADLNSVMDAAGVKRFPCSPGYIGLDCGIPDNLTLNTLSCYLKGKPGKSAGAVFIYNDPTNSVDIQKCMNKCVDDVLK
ncbi:hypothetical protein BB560_007291 [Smittium megazygosporum]|uniref:Uncharacterized protein n=1 Tax=Smittium megazygosporum TaxID=133381 RepID=A0A2T9XX57_9FUNG|nr:hypothetical protein BB560_007291 [Smittium megazygosporum]